MIKVFNITQEYTDTTTLKMANSVVLAFGTWYENRSKTLESQCA